MAATTLKATFRRPLSLVESWFAASTMTIRYTLDIDGPVDRGALRSAYRLLLREHPVLGGQFVPGRSGDARETADFDLIVPAASEEVLHEDREDLPFVDHAKGLAHVEVAERGDRTLVSFASHHAIADGRLSGHFHTRLWSLYTDIYEGRCPEVEPHPVPRAPEDLLAERSVPRVDSGADRLRRMSRVEIPERTSAPFFRDRIHLSEETTAGLQALARARDETLHTLVAGAVALVERRRLPEPGDVAVDFCVDSPMDWRDRLDPPARVWDVTNALGTSFGVVPVRRDSDPVALGAQLRAQMLEDIQTKAVYQGVLRFKESLLESRPGLPLATATNVGAIRPFRTPAGVSVRDFKGWVSFDGSAMADFVAAHGGDAANRSNSLYALYIYGGRLSVELGLLFDPDTSSAHSQELEELLIRLGREEA